MLAVEPIRESRAAPSDRPNVNLSGKQLYAIDLIWEYQLTKTWREIAEMVGVTDVSLWRWRQDPTFQSELAKRSRQNLHGYIPAAYRVVIDNMLAGKEWALGKFLELTGESDQAKLRGVLGAWIQLMGGVGVPQIRAIMGLVEQSRATGRPAQSGRRVVDREAQVVDDEDQETPVESVEPEQDAQAHALSGLEV